MPGAQDEEASRFEAVSGDRHARRIPKEGNAMSGSNKEPPHPRRSSAERAIQSLVLFSTLLGAIFLVQVYGVLPPLAIDLVATGWVLFVVDSVLTFVAPNASYVLAFALAILALASSLPQSSHYSFLVNGDLIPAATFVIGTAAQILLIVVLLYHFIMVGKRRQ